MPRSAKAASASHPTPGWWHFRDPDNVDTYSMTNGRVYVRAIADRGKPFRKIGDTLTATYARLLGQGR